MGLDPVKNAITAGKRTGLCCICHPMWYNDGNAYMKGAFAMAFVLSAFADEIDSSLDEQIRVLRQTGIRYVEYRSGDGKNISDHSVKEAEQAARRLQDAGIALSALGSPIGKVDITAPFAPHLDLFRHTLDLAEAMQAPYIRIFSFFMPQGEDPARYRSQVVDRMSAFAEAAQGRPVTLLHENEKEIYGDNPERCLDILQAVGSPKLRATYDFSNFVQCGCDNMAAWQLLQDEVVYFHLKDSVYSGEHAQRDRGLEVTGNGHRPVGEGDGCCRAILEQAQERGFDGFASVEPHLGEEYGGSSEARFLRAARAARLLLDQIGR